MLRSASTVVVAVLVASALFASDEKATVRRDTTFPVEIKHTIRASSAKVGDPVEFRTDAPVLIGNNIVVPDNSLILGTIVEVRHGAPDSPRSLVRIRIHTLRWKSGEAELNAMVSSVRRPHPDLVGWNLPQTPTFLEGIRVVSHQRRDAFTDFFSDEKEVKIRSGVTLLLRQIEPDAYPDREFNILDLRSSN